jgi:hypothetical protein
MKSLVYQIKLFIAQSPHLAHAILTAVLPFAILGFIRAEFVLLAFLVVLFSKWRMFAIRPRHWPASLRANSVDLFVGLSFVVFLDQTSSLLVQVFLVLLYLVWLILLKPRTKTLDTIVQAFIAQTVGLIAWFMAYPEAQLSMLVAGAWVITYFSARHFFVAFEEERSVLFSAMWGYLAASVTWVLGHWLLFYGPIAQPALILSVISYSLGTIYYLSFMDHLTEVLRRQLIFIMIAVLIVVVVFSDWGDKTV